MKQGSALHFAEYEKPSSAYGRITLAKRGLL